VFAPTSRYYTIETATLTVRGPDGLDRQIAYKRRRFLPPAGASTTVVEHRYAQGERLDNITARYLGDPTQFWQVCDPNLVLRPEELEQEIGRPIEIALPGL
jgi:hypothetical protein